MRLNPFRAVRPVPELAAQVAAVPYDVVNRAEAAELALGNPHSFLHVGRSDIDLPEDVDPYDSRIYVRAREALEELVARGTLLRDPAPGLYFYRQVMNGRTQTGVVGCVHIDDYERDVIRKHEKTRPDKEDDRTRHVLTLNANAEPVFLTYRGRPEINALADSALGTPPLYDFTAPDGVRHTVWRVPDPAAVVRAFDQVPFAYVADGHHRSASAWRAGKELRARNPGRSDDAEYEWFLAVLFPAEQLRILPYNRVVKDLNGMGPSDVLARLGDVGIVMPTDEPIPPHPGAFAIYLAGAWYRLELDPASINSADPIGSLDVSLLQDRVLGPIFGIGDPRTDKRIDFVGGIRGPRELERRVDSGDASIAFSLYPTTLDQLIAVSDAGQVMPPKSTWFEPKLRSGLFVHELG
ncbi:MAG: DUF1015 domain-containing protein [Gemmatimonadales bacterium]|nr:DUF1015 domain-containing protein [Gemmatimonadales bacterium]MBA3553824.1 DUF1015 domain-containing protein [Gemmatimonadales bacterium]